MDLDPEKTLWAVIAFIFGAAVGSFLNVCIFRLPRNQSIVRPGSRCPSCGTGLRLWPDMVPLLSQVFTWSRCRHCGQRFSWRYFWVELLTGLCFVGVVLRFWGEPWQLFPTLVFVSALIAIAFIDLEHYQILDELIYVALGAGFVKDVALMAAGERALWQPPHWIPGIEHSLPVPVSIWGAALCFWLLWMLAALASAAVRKEAMGAGDATLLAAMGANLWPLYGVGMAFMIAVVIGAVLGLARIALTEWGKPVAGTATVALATAGGGGGEGPPQPIPLPAAEPEPPLLPRDSRLGRLLAVMGTWAVALGGWWALAQWSQGNKRIAVVGGVMAFTVAAALIRHGRRLWERGDRVWAPANDQAFEEGLGSDVIPFGPPLVAGTLLTLFFGDALVQAYLDWMGVGAGL